MTRSANIVAIVSDGPNIVVTICTLVGLAGSSPRHESPERVLAECRDAVTAAEPSLQSLEGVDRACANLFTEPTCKQVALEADAADRAARHAAVARACGR